MSQFRAALLGATCLLLTALACVTVSCDRPPDQPQAAPPPPVVTVAEAEERTLAAWDDFSGRLEAVESVEVRPRVSGVVESVHFREGGLVSKGDLLVTLDRRTFSARRSEVKARRTQAVVELELATSELERVEPLVELRAVSQEELDQRRQRVASANALIAALDAELSTASLDLDFARVRAPVEGRLGRAHITEGNLVSGGSGDATILTTIVSLDPIYLYFTPDERAALRYLRRLRASDEHMPVEMRLADEDGYPHAGHLDFVDNRLDPATGTLLLRAVFDNAQGELLPGMFASVRLRSEKPRPVLLVPEQAVGRDQTLEFVIVVGPDNLAERRVVTTGRTLDGMRVVESGLEAGERVVTEGMQKAQPGTPVDPQPASLEPSAVEPAAAEPPIDQGETEAEVEPEAAG